MLIVRATKKLAERIGGFDRDAPAESDPPMLGEWYATAAFWRPQVAIFVSEATLLPVLVPLAPASSLNRRFPAALADVLRRQEVPGAFIEAELARMRTGVVLPTANRSMVGVVSGYVSHATHVNRFTGGPDLAKLEDLLAQTPVRTANQPYRFPDQELAALVAASL
ncbi:MAG: hypothetical protein WCI22_17575 [Actinomycetota bacterium]